MANEPIEENIYHSQETISHTHTHTHTHTHNVLAQTQTLTVRGLGTCMHRSIGSDTPSSHSIGLRYGLFGWLNQTAIGFTFS